MKKPYFIMMYNQNASIAMPIVHGDDEGVLFFETEKAARECANNQYYCKHLGYEIFNMNKG